MNFNSLLKWINTSSKILVILTILLHHKYVNSQIVPDRTLDSESSVIKSIDRLKEQIEGGAIRGANLFHSFQEFNVGEGQSVYFTNPAGIENILTRITGNNASNILGKLGVSGAANLFLINPNGIFFGANATLDIRGSFIATTADEIALGENGLFSATEVQNNNLLSVAPSALFFNQIATKPGNIINNATEIGLEIPRKETLGLVGNQVIIDGGKLRTEQGRIEIGSVGSNSVIKLENRENNYVLNYSEVEKFNNIEVKNQAVVDVSGEGSGEIQIQGNVIEIKEKSRIQADTLGSKTGGNISLTASESIEINDSLVDTDVARGATGNGASIITNTPGLTLTNRGEISAETFGEGDGGSIEMNAADVEVSNSFISADSKNNNDNDIARTTIGKAGNLTINTQRLSLNNGGRLLAVTSGASQGGNITVNAREIQASGISPDGRFASGIDSRVQLGATGDGGNLTINTERLIQTDGALILAGVFGSGQGGNITVNATEIELSGTAVSENLFPELLSVFQTQDQEPEVPTSLFTTVFPDAVGKGGNLTVNTQSLTLQDGALISTGTFGSGDSGELKVTATEINLIGVRPITQIPSGLFTSVSLPGATGKGGDLTVNTQNLTIQSGGAITTGTFGSGDSGELKVTATEINLIGTNSTGQFPSGLFTTVFFGATGNGGDLTVETESVRLINGAQIRAGTFGVGQSGDVTINATDSILISEVSEFGDSSGITVSSFGSGEAGSLSINAPSIEINNGILRAETAAGDRGNITIQASEINLTNNSQITTNASNSATGGDINIDTKFLIGFGGSNISANAIVGQGGNIAITAEGVFLDNSSQITTTSARGIELNTQVDPTQGVVKLSPAVINAESLVAQNLCATTGKQKQESSFVITGRGGLPLDPTQPLTVLRGTVEWESNTEKEIGVVMSEYQQPVVVYRRPETQNLPQITQAMGWVMNESGKVTLTSTANTVQLTHPGCYLFTN